MSAPLVMIRQRAYNEHRKPRPGSRELFVDGKPHGWVPPGWKVPAHGCITLREKAGYSQAFVESEDADNIYARTWTAEDTARFQASLAATA